MSHRPAKTRLEDAVKDPEGVPAEEAPRILAQLGGVVMAIAAKLPLAWVSSKNSELEEDRLLTVEEAAQRLGCSKDYLYRNAKQLPFTVRQGRMVRFSLRGIERYQKLRQGEKA